MIWSRYEEDTVRAMFLDHIDREIAEYLTSKGFKRTTEQVKKKRKAMGLVKKNERY